MNNAVYKTVKSFCASGVLGLASCCGLAFVGVPPIVAVNIGKKLAIGCTILDISTSNKNKENMNNESRKN